MFDLKLPEPAWERSLRSRSHVAPLFRLKAKDPRDALSHGGSGSGFQGAIWCCGHDFELSTAARGFGGRGEEVGEETERFRRF